MKLFGIICIAYSKRWRENILIKSWFLSWIIAHKSSLIMKQMRSRLKLLFTPACSPQFSPIENLFGLTKQRMMDFEITTKEKLA